MITGRSRRTMALAAALLLVVGARGASRAQQQQQQASPAQQQTPPAPGESEPLQTVPVFEAKTELVTINTSIVDALGRPVRGLTPADFVLKVDGKVRPVASVEFIRQDASSGAPVSDQYSSNEGASGGRLIMIVVDQGNIRQGGGQTFIRAAELLLNDLGPGDRVGLAVIPGGQVVNFTAHVELVRQSLGRITGGAPRFTRAHMGSNVGIAEALAVERGEAQINEIVDRECPQGQGSDARAQCIVELEQESMELAQHVRQQTANSLTALRQLMIRLGATPRAKTLVMLSEGLIIGRGLENVSWVSDLASRSKISMYAIQIDDSFEEINTSVARASTSQFEDRRLRTDGLHTLVGLTRGTVLTAVATADNAFTRLSLELTGYYLVGFEPTAADRDGKSHQISLQVKRPGVEVRARREFVIDAVSVRKRNDEELLATALGDPLLATAIRLRVAAYSLPNPGTPKVRMFLTAGLGRASDELPVRSVAYLVTDERGKIVTSRVDTVDRREEGDHRYQTVIPVEPGAYSVKFAAVDEAGHLGSVEHRFKAAYVDAGPFTIGDLVLADAEAHRAGKLRPAIEPEIRSDAVGAYVELLARHGSEFEAATATLEIAAGAETPALATTRMTISETRNAERRVADGEVSLASVAPGRYVARAIIAVNGRPAARILRPLTFDPTNEARVRMMTSSISGSGRAAPAAFERTDVLQPPVVEYFLSQAAPTSEPSASTDLAAGLAAAREGRFTELPDLLPREPTGDDPMPVFLRGLGLYARGELEPAAVQFRDALRRSIEFVPATFYLGACYAAGGRDREAVGAWQTTLAAETEAPFVYTLAADAYLRLKDWQSALETTQEASKLWPDDDGVRLRLARAYASGGRTGDALDALDAYLARHPDDHETLLLAMRLLYESAGTRPEAADADRRRFERYQRAYAAADGPERALIAEWLKIIDARARQ